MKTKKKGLHSNLVRVFGPKLGGGQQTRSSLTVFVLKPSAQVTKGEPCRNFAYYYMLIRPILSWRPKRGGMAQCPPLNMLLIVALQNFVIFYLFVKLTYAENFIRLPLMDKISKFLRTQLKRTLIAVRSNFFKIYLLFILTYPKNFICLTSVLKKLKS